MLDLLDVDKLILVGLFVIIPIIIFCVVVKMIRVAIGLFILLLLAPVMYNIFWGDGGEYIKNIASFAPPQYSQEIQDMYQYYKLKGDAVMSINNDTVSRAISDCT